MHVEFHVTCARCGGPVEAVNNDDPKGWVWRERRLVVSCLKRHCSWSGVVVAELVDLTHRRNVA